MPTGKFDLNIEKILENWEVFHGVREVVANALDEQTITGSKEIEIFKDQQGNWHIRDYGRGLMYTHLTQKENTEKLSNPHVIGKFGIGLKDALATFDRKGVMVLIRSRHGDITVEKSEKHGFQDLLTLHANVGPPSDPSMDGTEFMLDGLEDSDIEKAKVLFLKFSGDRVIEETRYGSVLAKGDVTAKIYANGVRVAEEPNFLFSYNITELTKSIRNAMNRERTNVGRTAYAERVKTILTLCHGPEVTQSLASDLKDYETGRGHDELTWGDVQTFALKILGATEKKAVFFTSAELSERPMMVDEAKRSGNEIVTIPQSLRERVRGLNDVDGNPIRDMTRFYQEYKESFEFTFVDVKDLTAKEKAVLEKTDTIFRLIGGKPSMIKEIRISETMRNSLGAFVDSDGVWEESLGRIVLKRVVLASVANYSGTLLHEVAHAISHAADVDREFELELTRLLGLVSSRALADH